MSNLIHSFSVEEAEKYGVEKAVILYNFRFWLTKNMANDKNNIDGYVWTYNSAAALAKLFPYLNAKKISRLLKDLEFAGALVTGNYNKIGYDRTKWYSMPEFSTKAAPIVISHICEMDSPDMSNGFPKFAPPIPDSKPNNKTDINIPPNPQGGSLINIPEWLDFNLFNDYQIMRKAIKSPMTEKASTILINKITKYRTEGHDPSELLETAILNNWKSVYPPKGDFNTGGQPKQLTEKQALRKQITANVLDVSNTDW